MHDALLISEVLCCIFDHLAGDMACHHDWHYPVGHVDSVGRQALAVLARTCRAFSEPALDAVWRRLHSLQPLLLCVLGQASLLDGDDDDIVQQASLIPFNQEQWNIVLRYAPRVQALALDHVHDRLSVQILQSLWFRTTLLLPNLRSLHWTHEDHTSFTSIRLLLSPSLVHLHLCVGDGEHTSVLGFLECYHILCPNLKSIEFSHSSRFPPVTTIISRAITRSLNLENLICNAIDEVTLIHVVQSRCLQKFSCNLVDYDPDQLRMLAGYGTPDHPPFETLRILELQIQDLSSIIPYFRSHHQPFEKVSIKFNMAATPMVLQEFFTVLNSATRRKTLRWITLHSPLITFTLGPPAEPVDFQILNPLMNLNLDGLEVCIRNPISLNDNEIIRLAQAWPRLETLKLNIHNGWDCPPLVQLPTLEGLLLLLARCPNLQDLGFSLDATNIPSLSEAEPSIRNTAIKILSVANSPIQEPGASVAHFLHKHLPSLTKVAVCISATGRRMDCHWTWHRVDKEIGRLVGRPPTPELDDMMVP